MDYKCMRFAVDQLCGQGSGFRVKFQARDEQAPRWLEGVNLELNSGDVAPSVALAAVNSTPYVEARQVAPQDHVQLENAELRAIQDLEGIAHEGATSPQGNWYMLITLGRWQDEPDSWDESPWGGSANETRNGFGYRPGMFELELLDAARLLWKFNPDSYTWEGITHALVGSEGLVRAVIEIDRYIGPFWGRFGFQGHVVSTKRHFRELIEYSVPRRRNPVSTIQLDH